MNVLEKAIQQFRKLVRDEYEFIVNRCFAENLESSFKEVNKFTQAAVQLGVTGITPFEQSEIESLVVRLKPLRTLKMSEEVRAIVSPEFAKHGFDAKFFTF